MKNAFCKTVCLGKLTGKNGISLLILTALVAILFIIPLAGCASRPTPTPTLPSNYTLTFIHMLDQTHGWALNTDSVLKTADGGLHWQTVLSALPTLAVQGSFLNDRDAWIATTTGNMLSSSESIKVLRTTDGGKSWQNSTIAHAGFQLPSGEFFEHLSDIEFLDPSNGWILSDPLSFPPTTTPAIFHTTDGGQHWVQLASPNCSCGKIFTSISFKDRQNGWIGAESEFGAPASLEVTHDGGKTWQNQSLPVLTGTSHATKPPVFSGNNGLLPVTSSDTSINLYVTHDGGQTWTPTRSSITGSYETLDSTIVDSQHAWIDSPGSGLFATSPSLFATSDSGQHWTQQLSMPPHVGTLDFINPSNGWATTPAASLLHTTDGGHTWQAIHYFVDGKLTTSLRLVPRPVPVPTPFVSSWKECGALFYSLPAGSTEPTVGVDPLSQQDVTCFVQAFQQCVPASIDFVVNSGYSIESKGVAVADNSFDTKSQSGECVIAKGVTVVNMQPQSQEAEICAQVKQTEASVSFLDCTKSGTITFPITASK